VLGTDVAAVGVADGDEVTVGAEVDRGAASSVLAGCGVSIGATVAWAVGSSVTAGVILDVDDAGDGVATGVGSPSRIPTSIPRQATLSASTATITRHFTIRSIGFIIDQDHVDQTTAGQQST
jgi:hypothetical protein